MKISGFSFIRNGEKLYYPIKESIESILPISDEFIIAVGDNDPGDKTRELIESINSPKVKIIDTVWDKKYMKRGAIHGMQTDIAKNACSGDWLFYLQADEVVHEDDLPKIKKRCEELLDNKKVEGLLFSYHHFWGDYDHHHKSHGWYPYEIRIIRNNPNIHSYESAQSFRYFEHYEHPHQKEGTRKLNVAKVDAHIFHYGWVRPPHYMQNKRKYFDRNHKGTDVADNMYKNLPKYFDYGPLNQIAEFKGTHPNVMHERINKIDWKDKLQYSGTRNKNRMPHKHERLKYKVVSLFEKVFNGGEQIGTFKNYELLKDV
jgi:hypothetical protein